jgi:hypothetical protein
VESLVLTGVAALQVGLVWAHLPSWQCPFLAVFGIPCPGCGLSTASVQLFHGDFSAALRTHAFAPLLVLVMVLILLAGVLPARPRDALVEGVRRFERATGLSAILLAGLFIYWGLRLFHIV